LPNYKFSNVKLINYDLYIYRYKLKIYINWFGLNPRGAGSCDMGFGKRLDISGEIPPRNLPSVLTKLVETGVVSMWI